MRARSSHIARIALALGMLAFFTLGCSVFWDANGRAGDDIDKPAPTDSTAPTESNAGGDTQLYEDDSAVYLLKIESLLAVENGGTEPSFEVPSPHTITAIMTYHWNDGSGSTPGTISLRAADGTTYGPWQAEGKEGQGGVPNAYWWAYPNEAIPPGTYTVVDSEPNTWAQNEDTGGRGVAWVQGVPAEGE